ncbi:MAG TPA: SBBP repeat-containing protein [Chloroflexia bacterium]|nr:SBBP repeat-containing protein [Chloroflexia bacterium]
MLARVNYSPGNPRKIFLVWAAIVLLMGSMLLASLGETFWRALAPAAETPSFGSLPLSFEPNAGQSDPSVRFMAHAGGSTLFFAPSEVVLSVAPPKRGSSDPRLGDQHAGQEIAIGLQFVGSNPAVAVRQGDTLPGKVNYLKGKDPSLWLTDLPTYSGIIYSELYSGVNLSYTGASGRLKGTYTLGPDADPSTIQWRYNGAGDMSLDAEGNLHMRVQTPGSAGSGSPFDLTESTPQAWQVIDGQRVTVSSRYDIHADGSLGFAVGAYDHSQALIIDPTLIYSTYLGGFYGDGAGSIWLDSAGDIYVGGTTNSSDFPVAGDPFQPVYGGGDYDMFASKLSPDGSSLIYSTFIGGSDWDQGDLAGVDAAGIATLGGWTASENFPTTPGAYQTSFAGTEDVAVAKLSADGSDLIFGSYWGDSGVDEPYGFTVDGAGNTYFTGYYFPGFSSRAFLAALSPDGTQQVFQYSLGGSVPGPGDENANTSGEGVVVDAAGNIYVTGYTRAADFPTTPGAYRTSIEAFEDGFITKLSPSAQSLIYSTYIPGGVSDYPYDIAIDQEGNAYITGNTSSTDYPTTTGAFESACGDPRCAFITKLNPTGSDLVYSSFLGGPDFHFETEDYGVVVRVNQAGNAYVAGYTSAPDFPIVNPIQATLHGTSDGFLTKFNLSGSGVEYSTYLGGASGDFIVGIALDGLGHVYLAGSTSSTDFPVVNPLQPTNHGEGDAFVAVIAEESAVTRTPTATETGTPPTATPTPNPCGGVTPWRTETPMLTAHSGSASAVLNNQLYVIGGASNSPTPVRSTQKFDPVSNSWSNHAAYPDGLGLAYQQAVAVDGKIYTIGDTYQPSESFIEMYDPESDSWTRKATLPEALGGGGLTSYAGNIYVIGGQVVNQLPSPNVYEYDPVADAFTVKAAMPTGQSEIGAAAIGDRIYAVGGYQYIHYVYDPAANSWSTIAVPLTPSFSSPAVLAFNGELWVIGGYDNWTRRGYPPDQEVQIYNPATNAWRYGPALNVPRYHSSAAGVINDRAYLVGGVDLNSNEYPYNYLRSMESIVYLPCGTATPTTPTATLPPATLTATITPAAPTETMTYVVPTSSVLPSTLTATISAASPTATYTQTGQPSATPTICALQFTDVPPGSTFYSYIRCMACLGILSGYTSGCDTGSPCFKPGNIASRGQIAKIVSNAAGFHETVSGQTFTDVVPGSTFYEYVERMASRGIISGYPDGTFRPSNTATRGQIAKIDANSAGYLETTGAQQYEDVAPDSTFYDFVWRLSDRGLVNGYPCGGTGEPCGPNNLPYFRPDADVTRGQASKIVSNTFFPDCASAPGGP